MTLVGDSIRLGYQPLVAALLGGSVEITGPDENCGDSSTVRRRIGDWVRPDTILVLFNAGLHDLARSRRTGRRRVEIDRYESNLAGVVETLRRRDLRNAFVTTTPVDDQRHAASGKPTRLAIDVRTYNEAARRIMVDREVPVVDLYPLIGPTLLAADGVHLTAEGSAVAAREIAKGIVALL